MNRLFLLCAVCLCLVGCSTTQKVTLGNDFDAAKREQIIKQVSTREDVAKLYGEPTDKTIDENYNEKWEYRYAQRSDKISLWDYSSQGTIRMKKLTVVFDDKGVVQNFVFSDSAEPITSGK